MARRGKAAIVDIKIRMREPLRAKVEAAAKENSVSMNAEMVSRLERTFQRQDTADRFLRDFMEISYGPKLGAMLEAIGHTLDAVGIHANIATTNEQDEFYWRAGWIKNPYAFEQAVKAANAVLETFRPPGRIVAPLQTAVESERRLPLSEILDALRGRGRTPESRKWAKVIREQFADN